MKHRVRADTSCLPASRLRHPWPRATMSADRDRMTETRKIPSLRWWIGVILFTSTVINYIDRQTLSILAPFLKQDFHWTNTDYANIALAFRVAYSIGQTVFGRQIDRVGTRRGLTISVTWYSLVSLLTSLATGLASFAGFRFLLGLGESANWPGAST